jgi:threonine dehydrogenase-like Zn-dependent dehydrogenase
MTVHCPNAWTGERVERTLELIAEGPLQVGELVTHTCPYTEAPAVYQMILDKSQEFLGIVFEWNK